MKTTYNINFTDNTKDAIILAPSQKNDSTSLVLYGYGSYLYGESLWENMLHLLENFSDENEPTNSIEGQLWYNSKTSELNLRVKDSDGKLLWKNITPASGFDAGNLASIKEVTSLLTKYVPITAGDTAKLTGSLYLNDTNENYSKIALTDGSYVVYPKTDMTDTNKFTAVTRMFVESKIKQEIDKKVDALTPIGSGVSKDSVLTALNGIGPDANKYLRRDGTDVKFRTMADPLILRMQTSTTTFELDEAVSKRYLDSRFTASASVVNATNILKIINEDLVLNENNKTNLVSKLGDVMNGHLYLPGIEDFVDTKLNNNNVAISKAYLESKLDLGSRPTISPTTNVSYAKTPDGTIMVYGNSRGRIERTETTAIGSKNWCNATIQMPVSFTNAYYSVTITEEIPPPIPATLPKYPLPRHQYGKTLSDITDKPQWPLTFSVYDKTVNSFKVCVFVPSGMDADYIANTLLFNFIAIGR